MFNCLSLERPLLWRGVRRNPWTAVSAAALLAVQMFYTYTPFMQRVFHSAALGLGAWARIIVFAVAAYLLIEIIKRLQRD